MPKQTSSRQGSFFSATTLGIAILSAAFLGTLFVVSQLHITPAAFSTLNTLMSLGYCITAPIALTLGIIGYRSAQNSRKPFLIAIGIAVIPFMILFVQFAWSFTR